MTLQRGLSSTWKQCQASSKNLLPLCGRQQIKFYITANQIKCSGQYHWSQKILRNYWAKTKRFSMTPQTFCLEESLRTWLSNWPRLRRSPRTLSQIWHLTGDQGGDPRSFREAPYLNPKEEVIWGTTIPNSLLHDIERNCV